MHGIETFLFIHKVLYNLKTGKLFQENVGRNRGRSRAVNVTRAETRILGLLLHMLFTLAMIGKVAELFLY